MEPKRTTFTLLKRWWRFARQYRSDVALVSGLSVVAGLLSLAAPYLTKTILDDVLIGHGGIVLLFAAGGALLAAAVIGAVIVLIRDQLSYYITDKAVADLRSEYLHALERLPLKYYDQTDAGTITARLDRDVENIRYTSFRLWGEWLSGACQILVALPIMAVLDWRLCLVAILPLAVALWWLPALRFLLADGYRRWRVELDRLTNRVAETMPAVRVLRLFGAQARETRYAVACAHQVSRARFLRIDLGFATEAGFASFMYELGPLVVLVIGSLFVLSGETTVGTLVAVTAYVRQLEQAVWGLVDLSKRLQETMMAAENLFSVIDHPEAQAVSKSAVVHSPDTLVGEVEFRDVWFSYGKDRPALEGVNLKVAPGEMIGLVGRTGAGKSTLIKLVCGFYRPDQGEVLIDGIPVWEYDHQELMRFFGVVPQDNRLLAGSVADNIAYGLPEASREAVVQAAIAAGAHDFVARLPQAYHTSVGSGGQFLSGGEQQRIAIARAIVRDPRILILDEPTASVDLETEEEIQRSLDRLIVGRTVFAIAHRLSTLRRASRLIVIEGGRIVEEGPHETLVSIEGGRYRQMVELHRKVSQLRVVA